MQKSITYKNCDISKKDMTIVEVLKDSAEEFSIMDILEFWDGETGVDISFKKTNEILSSVEEDSDGGDE